MYVLDTNIVIAALNGVGAVRDRLVGIAVTEVGIPLPVIGELLYGAHRSQKQASNLARIARLRETFPVLALNAHIMERYAEIRATLHRAGLSRSDFDLLIASTAIEHDAVLVTHDQALHSDFGYSLTHEDWLA